VLTITGLVVGALVALVVLYFFVEPVTLIVVTLLLVGVGLEVGGLWTIWRDLEDVETTAKRIAGETASKVGARVEVVVGWMNEMAGVASLPRRRRGVMLIALGLAMQTFANVIALWS
jgi:hypothetical protein